MKRLFFALAVIIAIVLAGCNKLADEAIPASQQDFEIKKSENPIPFNGSFTGLTTIPGENCTCDQASGWICRNFSGEGNANHIGNSDLNLNYCMRYSYPTPDEYFDGLFEGPGTMTTANGEVLEGYFTGTFDIVWENGIPIKSLITADGILYSGTGNYEGITAYMHAEGEMDLTATGPIPTTLNFTGFLQYAGELFDGEVEGFQDMVTLPGCDGNSWNFAGDGQVAPLGPVTNTNDYCSQTIYGPWPYPVGSTIAYGGTMEGVGTLLEIEDPDGDELYSTYTGVYSFFYNIPINVTNFAVGTGIITGGTGKYEGATGRFIMTGVQDVTSLVFTGNTQDIPGSFKFTGYVIY